MRPSSPPSVLHQPIFESSPILKSVAARVAEGGVLSVGRAGEGVSGFLLAYLSTVLERTLLVITATLDETNRVRRDWSTFRDAPVSDFLPWESIFEKDSEPDPETFAQRYEILQALSGNEPVSLVAPVQAVLQPDLT